APARREPTPAPADLPECWSAAEYAGPVREAILAYKERGQTALAHPLATALAFTATHALASRPPAPVVVVPVPSAARAGRARGHDPVGGLAALTVRLLAAQGHRAELWPALTLSRRVADQAGLNATQRAANLAAGHQVRPGAKPRPALPVLLLDDLVTTGSTLAGAARTLRSHGAVVLYAVTVAATRRRS
uniref:ComF family protein n=1 Tax=Nonomuraea rhizosphaerae TaxID=2665663 RepID=UPI001C5CF0C1